MVSFKKADEELQIVWGEVYAPDFPDSQGDFMKAETIRKMAYNFLAKQRVNKIDVNHDNNLIEAVVVESFIARKGDPDFIENAWVVGVHIANPQIWAMVKSGDLNGFSLEGVSTTTETILEVDLPTVIKAETMSENEHTHNFTVYFSEKGDFIGGYTDEVGGHSHKIVKGTVTEETDGHRHKFSFMEAIFNGASEAQSE